jgi:hypothetical protein
MTSTMKFNVLSTTDGTKTQNLSTIIDAANSVIINDWAAKTSPSAWSSAYKNVWAKGAGSSKSLDHSSLNYGIRVLVDGYYEVRLHQRMTGGGDNFVGIAIDGNRTTLESRVDGVWTHSHGTYSAEFTDSYYIGKLFANEIITGGGPSSTNLVFPSLSYAGVLIIKRIG